jgi:hypothetical protein
MRRRNLAPERTPTIGLVGLVMVLLILFCIGVPHSGMALETDVKGLSIMGYINQSTTYSLNSNRPDNKDGFNSFVTQALLETRYEAMPNLVMFGSVKFNADWAYPIYSGNNEWRDKEFNHARDREFIFYKPRDVIGEAHVTWKPTQNSYFRIGKQIVQWGETDGFLLMNQINPIDQRRGITDVEFENSLIPTWLIRSEYRVPGQYTPTWLQDLNFQFIWDPNLDFAANQNIELGNTKSGIWAPYVVAVPAGGLFPGAPQAYLAEYRDVLSKPDSLDPQGQAFAARISGTVMDARVTLNGYYGRAHEMVRSGPIGADVTTLPFNGDLSLHPYYEAYYPIFKFVGATFTKDIDWLRAAALGNVAPVMRFEGLYAFNSTFSTNNGNAGYYNLKQNDDFWKSDEWRAMIGADWKVRIRPLNEKAFFFISAQYYWRHIVDYPGVDAAGAQQRLGTYVTDIQYQDTHTTSLMVNTSFLTARLQPSFFWLRNWSTRCEFFRPQISYEWSDHWKYTLGAIFVSGEKTGQDLQPFNYKDHVYATVSYKF